MATSDCKNEEEIKVGKKKKKKKRLRCLKYSIIKSSEILSTFFKARKNMSLQ